MSSESNLAELEIMPGVMPYTDATPSDIPCWAYSNHVRFDPNTGRLKKIGGWNSLSFDDGQSIMGTARTVFSATINQKVYTIIGTNTELYSIVGSRLDNITPLKTTSVAAPNSLSTHYGALGSNPITTVSGSNFIAVSDPSASKYRTGDNYTLSGSSSVNGIPSGDINSIHTIRALGSTTVSFYVATSASSSGSGGGASVIRSDGLITLTKTDHGLLEQQRVKMAGAANIGGILATSINKEFIIRNVTTNTFDFMTDGASTSSVSSGGGASAIYYQQIDPGNLDQRSGQGYGAGLYGVGLYGTALTSQAGEQYPRIWFCDRFGDNIIMTFTDSVGIFTWNGDTSIAPVLIPNAPIDVNYAFVSDDILVTFGHDLENEIFSSDIGNYATWIASSTNQVFQDVKEGAGRLITHCKVDGGNLIFTTKRTYIMKYIGLPNIWQILQLDENIGIISPMARVSVNGIAYWMGNSNFYMYRGGKVEIIPSNMSKQSSILRYVFGNLNSGQRFKCFAWYNELFDEIWFHYPSQSAAETSSECSMIARFSRTLQCWTPDTMQRTAAEWPALSLSVPRLANVGRIYNHETGNDDDGLPMEWTATTKKYFSGTNNTMQSTIVPDCEMNGTANLGIKSYSYPQSSSARSNVSLDFSNATDKIVFNNAGRFWEYTISGNDLDQEFLMGQWYTDAQQAGRHP